MARFDLGPKEFHFGETVARFSELLCDHQGYMALRHRYMDYPFGFYYIPIFAAATLVAMEDNGEVEFGIDGRNDWLGATELAMDEIVRQALDADDLDSFESEGWIRSAVREAARKPKDWSPRG